MMKKCSLFLTLVIAAILSIPVSAAEPAVLWSKDVLTKGSLEAELNFAPNGAKAVLAFYHDGELAAVNTKYVSEGKAKLSVNIPEAREFDCAKVFIWDNKTLSPYSETVSSINISGAGGNLRELWYSDDQKNNHSGSIAYHSFEPQEALYKAGFDLTIVKNSDAAVLFGSSGAGNLTYSNSAVTLLFNGGKFTVKNGDGNGNYTDSGTVLCPVHEGQTYHIEFNGSVADNTYAVSITDQDGKTYESGDISARKNAASIDTVGFISNSVKTTVSGGKPSGFRFYAENFKIIPIEETVVYTGFAGRYYALRDVKSGKYIRGNNGRLTVDYTSVKDTSAMFMPRDMGDGGFAFECRSSKNRITAQTAGGALKSAAYVMTDNSQHWQLIESESFSEENKTYYIKNMLTGDYAAAGSGVLSSGSEGNKAEIRFIPLDEESPLVKVSGMNCYKLLSRSQRSRIEEIYESVAGDAFGRYGGISEYTFRMRIDTVLEEILPGELTDKEAADKLINLLKPDNNHVVKNIADSGDVSSKLPGTEGVTMKKGAGVDGTYVFWRTTQLKGTKYPLDIYGPDGELQQTITLYVQDDNTARHNADSFCKIVTQIPYQMRKFLKSVRVRYDSANSFNGGGSDLYIRVNWNMAPEQVKSTVFHELGHIVDNNATSGWWSGGGKWKEAMAKDMICASTYARSSNAEDFAEFNRMYFACYQNPDKQRALKILFPNRYASYQRLRNSVLDGYSLWDD